MRLAGKVAVVTGGGSGIGRGIVLAMAREGADIAIADIQVLHAEKVATEVKALGRKVVAMKTDVTSAADVKAMVDRTREACGRIDILVNNAGAGSTPGMPFTNNTEEDWDRTFAVNTKSVFLACKSIAPYFIEGKGAMDLHARNTDFVFTAKVRSQSSSVLFVNGMPGVDPAPALFTRMSILPHASRVRSTIALTSAALVTSVFIATTLRPSALTSVATFSACSTWMSAIAMSAPSRAIASTIPRPMPLPPPVTTATLPASRMRISFLYNRCLGGFP